MDMTLLVGDESVQMVEGKIARATLAYSADGLMVYQLGTSKHQHEDLLRCLVLNACEARHIPIVSLRNRRVPLKAGQGVRSDTVDMFAVKNRPGKGK